MINSEFIPPEELQVVNGRFTVDSGSQDPSAFFNMGNNYIHNPYNNGDDDQNQFNANIGGFGNNFFGNSRQDQINLSNPPPAPAPQPMQQPQCHGNCGACMWSFLCKSASKNFAAIGSGVLKLS